MLCVKYVFSQHQEMHLTVERGNLESEGLRLATGKAPKNRRIERGLHFSAATVMASSVSVLL